MVYDQFWYLPLVGPRIRFLLLLFYYFICSVPPTQCWIIDVTFWSLRQNFGQSVVYFGSILPAFLKSTCCFWMTLIKLGWDDISTAFLIVYLQLGWEWRYWFVDWRFWILTSLFMYFSAFFYNVLIGLLWFVSSWFFLFLK